MLGLERRGDIEAVLRLDQSGGQGSRLVGRVVVTALISLAAALLLYFWARTGNSASVSYLTDRAARGSLVVTVSATGTVQPVNDVDVSSEQSGTIRKVHVDFNQRIKAGQILAELDTDKLVSAVARARATVAARPMSKKACSRGNLRANDFWYAG